jgi:hypothetical protein
VNIVSKILEDINKGNTIWIKAFKDQNPELLHDHFHSEGAILGSNGNIVKKDELLDYLNESMKQIGSVQFAIETINVYEMPEGIYEKGSYVLTFSDERTVEGHFVVIWKYEDDVLKFYRDIGV